MGQHRGATHKVCQGRHGLAGARGVCHVHLTDARELHDLCRDEAVGVDEGLEGLHDLAAAQAGGRDLYERAVLEREACGLGVKDHNVVLEQTKLLGMGTFGKRRVGRADRGQRARKDEVIQRLGLVHLGVYLGFSSRFGV